LNACAKCCARTNFHNFIEAKDPSQLLLSAEPEEEVKGPAIASKIEYPNIEDPQSAQPKDDN